MTSQDMTHDTGPGEDDEVVIAELVEDAGALEPRVPVVGVDPQYVDLYRRLRAEGGVDLREQLHDRYLQLARGGVTAGGLPWPSPTDPVAEGADAIRALAEAVDANVALTTVTPVASTGWSLFGANAGGAPSGVAFAARTGNLVSLNIVVQNSSDSAISTIGGITVLTGLPAGAPSSFFTLTVYSYNGSHPGPPRTDMSAYINTLGHLGVRGAGSVHTIAAGAFFTVAGTYPCR